MEPLMILSSFSAHGHFGLRTEYKAVRSDSRPFVSPLRQEIPCCFPVRNDDRVDRVVVSLAKPVGVFSFWKARARGRGEGGGGVYSFVARLT